MNDAVTISNFCYGSISVGEVNSTRGGTICEAAVPFGEGQVFDVGNVRLRDNAGSSIRCDVDVTLRWPDGSARWARLTWTAVHGQIFHVIWEAVAEADQDEQSADGIVLPEIPALASESIAMRTIDQELDTSLAVTLEIVSVDGTRQTHCIAAKCCDALEPCSTVGTMSREGVTCDDESQLPGNSSLVPSTITRSYHDQQTQRRLVTLRNPRAASHPGGIWELGDPNAEQIESARIVIRPRSNDDTPRRRILKIQTKTQSAGRWQGSAPPWRLSQLGSGGRNFQGPVHANRDGKIPITVRGFRVATGGDDDKGEGVDSGGRATPSMICEWDDGTAVGIFIPKFWQQFPKAIGCTDGEIAIDIFPSEFGVIHELQPGEQTSFEFWLITGNIKTVQQRLEAVENPLLPRIDPTAFCQTAVIPWLTPRDATVSPEYVKYLRLVDQAIQGGTSFFSKRERIDEYGWRNFGDAFADHESAYRDSEHPNDLFVSHYNNQYDMIYGLGVQYLTGGDAKYLELMQDLARHVIDIDIYHTDDDLPCYNHGLFWHTAHYIDAGLSTHRGYPRGSCGGGPSSGHAYARGLLLYYSITGDPTASEAVEKLGEWMIAAEDGRHTRYRWLAGGETGLTSASGFESYHGPGRGPGNAIEVLLSAYELTQQRRFLDQCELLIRRCVHPDVDPESLDLLDVENKWFYLIFLQALGRYLEVKISTNEIDSMYAYGQRTLLRYADWMAEHEQPFLTHPQKLEYPNETWAAQDIRKAEVFQWAARHATGDRRERYLERARWFFKHAIEELDGFETKGLCRPIALLLANGYSYEFFHSGGLDTIPMPPHAPSVSFAPHAVFQSQKTRAIRNLKRILVLAMATLAGTVVAGVWWWVNR